MNTQPILAIEKLIKLKDVALVHGAEQFIVQDVQPQDVRRAIAEAYQYTNVLLSKCQFEAATRVERGTTLKEFLATALEPYKPEYWATSPKSETWTTVYEAFAEKADNAISDLIINCDLVWELKGETFRGSQEPETQETHTAPVADTSLDAHYPWIRQLYSLVAAASTAKALRVLYWGLEDLLADGDFLSLNRILTEINVEKLNAETMVGLIRVTNRARKALPAWHALRQRIEDALRARKVENWEELLVGLTE